MGPPSVGCDAERVADSLAWRSFISLCAFASADLRDSESDLRASFSDSSAATRPCEAAEAEATAVCALRSARSEAMSVLAAAAIRMCA